MIIINPKLPDSLVEKHWRAQVWIRQNPFANLMRLKRRIDLARKIK